MKKIISTDDAPSAIGTYSQGVLVNDFLYDYASHGRRFWELFCPFAHRSA